MVKSIVWILDYKIVCKRKILIIFWFLTLHLKQRMSDCFDILQKDNFIQQVMKGEQYRNLFWLQTNHLQVVEINVICCCYCQLFWRDCLPNTTKANIELWVLILDWQVDFNFLLGKFCKLENQIYKTLCLELFEARRVKFITTS